MANSSRSNTVGCPSYFVYLHLAPLFLRALPFSVLMGKKRLKGCWELTSEGDREAVTKGLSEEGESVTAVGKLECWVAG